MTQPPLFDMDPKWHDLWGGKRLDKDEFEHLFHDDPNTIRHLAAIKDVGEYKPAGADEGNWYAHNISYTNDQMYRDLNHVYRVHRGRFPEDEETYRRINRQEGPYKDVHSEPEEIHAVGDDMDYGHTHSRMHGTTALHRGIKSTLATFGEPAYGDLTGHTFVEHAPMSTSPSEYVANSFQGHQYHDNEPAHLYILAPKGTPAMSTMWHGGKESEDIHNGESEVILGRGGRYHVVHDTGPDTNRQIYLQYIGPDVSIHGKADLNNLQRHDPYQRLDLNMDRLYAHTAREATGDDFDKYRDAGYDYEVEPHPEYDQATVRFTKNDYNRGLNHTIEYQDLDPHGFEWPHSVESTIRPLSTPAGMRSYVRPNQTRYLDQDGETVFDQAQAHLNEHPDDSYFRGIGKTVEAFVLAVADTWEA